MATADMARSLRVRSGPGFVPRQRVAAMAVLRLVQESLALTDDGLVVASVTLRK
jgi:hypothetical protein